MRILLLTPRPPWPPIDGGRIAMGRLAEGLLHAGASVEIVSLNPRKHRAKGVQAPLPMQTVDIDTSRVAGPAFSRGTPFIVSRFLSGEYREAIRAALRRFKPDVVQIESPFLLPYVATVREECDARVVLRSLNVEFRIWEGLVRNERNALRRFALRRVAASLRAYEVRHFNTPDAIVPISANDGEEFLRLGCTRPMHVVPCGVTLSDRSKVRPEPGTVGFIGSLDFRPNQEAVMWIVDELWPRVTARTPEAHLSLAGSGTPDWLRRRAAGQNIAFLGQVDDAEAFLQRMSVVIAPLFAGGGMRIKVLEAMALAKPIVATALGAGGIDVQSDRDIIIADDVMAFAGGVTRLLHEPETAARIGTAARNSIIDRYDNDTLARGLLRFYESLL
ncbi:MAG TPA: glycosyltransferase family 4 protein [Thermoanaerobaculia bacterium]|nr:glycosyltransferase family 4 protein [Thermoanaerobaculia bacterium]